MCTFVPVKQVNSAPDFAAPSLACHGRAAAREGWQSSRLLSKYLHFCISKASKLSTVLSASSRRGGNELFSINGQNDARSSSAEGRSAGSVNSLCVSSKLGTEQ